MSHDDVSSGARSGSSRAIHPGDHESAGTPRFKAGGDEHGPFGRLIRHSPHAMAVTGSGSHRLLSVNPAFCRLMRVDPDEVLGRGFAEALPAAAGRGLVALLDRAFHGHDPVREHELVRPRAQEPAEVWLCSAWALGGRAGDPRGVVLEISDRTDSTESRRQLEDMAEEVRMINERLLRSALEEQEWAEKAEAANRAKSDFLSMMSHELRTPLSGILGNTDVLAMEALGPVTDRQRESLARISVCSSQLLELIDDVLAYARMEARADQVRREPVDLCALAREAAAVVEPLAARKGLDMHLSLPERPLELDSDSMKLRQILVNLLANAVKFTEAGEVCLEVRQDRGEVHVLVTDTGIGIRSADLERIFEPFVQVEHGTTRRFGGTGLGLPISRAFASLLGGDLSVRSALGKGSTFAFHLPLDAD